MHNQVALGRMAVFVIGGLVVLGCAGQTGESMDAATTGSGGSERGSGGGGGTGGTGGTGSGGTSTGGTVGTGGMLGTGGTIATGGTTGAGGTGAGGTHAGGNTGTGGTGTGGMHTGGASGSGGTVGTGGTHTGGATGTAGMAGAGGATGTGGAGTGGTSATGQIFNPCRFHFGALDGQGTSTLQQVDTFTTGWMGQKDTFDMSYVCTEANAGGKVAGKVPVLVAYVAAFYAKRHFGRCDCNVTTCGANNDLCHYGAADIQQNLTSIINVYKSYAQGFASCYGTTKPIVFEMEPDWYQYTYTSQQTMALTEAQAGTIMGQFVDAIRQSLPNASFSLDISPWVGSNGSDNGKEWYSHFDMSKFSFINTSGGSTDATSTKIRSSNNMTWAGVSQVTGKPILADTGYGVNGSSAGPDPNWDVAANINARMADGVVAITQYNPAATWGTTIATVRSQLNAPKTCP
jgi:hypothetical protein